MSRLVYAVITSLDGFVEDSDGKFDWGSPDEQQSRFINELERSIGTYLFGRRMYETMLFWESPPADLDLTEDVRDFIRIWQGAEKVVYSRTLKSVSSAKTRIEPSLDPEAVRRLKSTASHDLAVGGANLAGQAIAAGLVDELHQFVMPLTLGGGKPWLPKSVRLNLKLLDSSHFASGAVFLRYRIEGVESRTVG